MFGKTTIKTPFDEPAASAEELREALRLEDDEYDEEDLLTDLLMAATDYAQGYLGRSLTEQVIQRQFEAPKMNRGLSATYMKERPLLLPYPPVKSIDRVYMVDNFGDETDIDSDDYWLDDKQDPPELVASISSWSTRLVIEYTTGYTTIPDAIKRGVLLHAAHLYSHRGDLCETEEAAKASGAIAVYRRYKILRMGI